MWIFQALDFRKTSCFLKIEDNIVDLPQQIIFWREGGTLQLSINVEICLKFCISFYYFILKQSDVVDIKLDAF